MLSFFAELFRDRDYFYQLRKIALPIVIQQFVFAALNMAGVAFMGQKGDTAVAAAALAGQAAFLVNLVHFGTISGAAMFTAQFWGRGDIQNLKRVLGLCLLLTFTASSIFFAISQFIPEQFLGIYSTDPEVIALGVDYMRIYSWTFLFMAISASYVFVLRSTRNVKMPTYVSMFILTLNAFLTYGLIFGNFGLPEMGVNGAAVAATIARGLECAILLFVIYVYKFPVAASLRELFNFDRVFVSRVIRPMGPVIVNELFWSLGVTTYYSIYGRMGTESVAAVNIASSVEQLAFVFFVGLANSTAVLVGNAIGAEKEDQAYVYGGRAIALGIVGGVVMGGALFALRSPVVLLFQVSTEVSQNAANVLAVSAVFMWMRVNNMSIIVGILRAGGDTKFSMFLDGFIIWIVGVPLAALGAFFFSLPVQYVFLCVMSEEIAKWILGIRRWRSKKWINNLAKHVEGL